MRSSMRFVSSWSSGEMLNVAVGFILSSRTPRARLSERCLRLHRSAAIPLRKSARAPRRTSLTLGISSVTLCLSSDPAFLGHLISVNVHGGEIQRKARSATYLQIVVRVRTARERLVEAHHAHASWGRQHRAQTEGRPCGRPFDSELICLNATGTILSVSRK